MKKKDVRTETKIPVKLTLRERDLIRSGTFPDPDFGKGEVIEGGHITVDLSLDEIEEIQGYVAGDATHTNNARRERELDRLCDKLQVYLDRYED